jgi:hypothetical protein
VLGLSPACSLSASIFASFAALRAFAAVNWASSAAFFTLTVQSRLVLTLVLVELVRLSC